MVYFRLHLLALSTPGPFLGADDTGLASHRFAVVDDMPRTGLPGSFDSWVEYERYVSMLVKTSVMQDTRDIW